MTGEPQPKFPTLEEQREHWEKEEQAKKPKPKFQPKWSLARRRRFNAKKAAAASATQRFSALNPRRELHARWKYCPHCGGSLKEWRS